jgi:hypothetical protein
LGAAFHGIAQAFDAIGTDFETDHKVLFSSEQRKNEEEQHGAEGTDQQLSPERPITRNAKVAENPTTQETADNADDDTN